MVKFPLIFLMILLVFQPNSLPTAQATKQITYDPPLAYIGWDGNIWITDLKSGAGVRITRDGIPLSIDTSAIPNVPNGTEVRYYSGLAWSPDGNMLAAGRSSGMTNGFDQSLLVFPSGKASIHFEGNIPALWNPDGNSLVYSPVTLSSCPGLKATVPVYQLSILSHKTQMIAMLDCFLGAIGDGPGSSDYYVLLAREAGIESQMFVDPNYKFTAVVNGYLFTRTDAFYMSQPGMTQMIAPDGKTLWQAARILGLSPDRKFGYLTIPDGTSGRSSPAIIDLATGKQSPSGINAPKGDVFALSEDRKFLFYSQVEENSTHPDYSRVSLWQLSLETGKAEALFTRSGAGIGVITSTPDDTGLIVSLVTSTAIVGDKDRPTVAEGRAHLELLYVDLDSHKMRLIALGGQPTLGSRPFMPIPAR